MLLRNIVPADTALLRMAKSLRLESVRGRSVFLDGYNVIITAESLMAGFPVYLCDDGLVRDTRGYFRRYKSSQFATSALCEILDLLAEAAPSRLEVLLDQQVSRSGDLASIVRAMMGERHLLGDARCVRDADHQLKICGGIVSSSDGNVIDAATNIIDLPAEIARRRKISTQIV